MKKVVVFRRNFDSIRILKNPNTIKIDTNSSELHVIQKGADTIKNSFFFCGLLAFGFVFVFIVVLLRTSLSQFLMLPVFLPSQTTESVTPLFSRFVLLVHVFFS